MFATEGRPSDRGALLAKPKPQAAILNGCRGLNRGRGRRFPSKLCQIDMADAGTKLVSFYLRTALQVSATDIAAQTMKIAAICPFP